MVDLSDPKYHAVVTIARNGLAVGLGIGQVIANLRSDCRYRGFSEEEIDDLARQIRVEAEETR